MKEIVIKKKPLLAASLIYIYIPVLIFLFGFIKVRIALTVTAVLVFCTYRFIKFVQSEEFSNEQINLNKWFVAGGILFLLIYGYFCGWGRWVEQTGDWFKHNAVLQDLVDRTWPVYYENGDERSMLTYYVGQYLVPACLGKLVTFFDKTETFIAVHYSKESVLAGRVGMEKVSLAFRTAEIAQYVWSELGLMLVWLNLMVYLRLDRVWKHVTELFVLLFFSVPQSLVEILVLLFYNIDCLYKNNIRALDDEIMLQYSGNYVCLSWVFIQTIVPWLVILIFLNCRNNPRYYLFYMLPMILFAPLPFLGLIPMALGNAVHMFRNSKKKRELMCSIFSIDNIICLLSFGTLIILYFYGNVFETKEPRLSFRVMHYGNLAGIYLTFVVVNVLIYAVYLFRDNRKDILYYIAIGELIILPFFCMGYYNDLNMRSSIPALFFVMILIIRFLCDEYINVRSKKELKTTILFLIFIAIFCNAVLYQVQRFDKKVFEEDYLHSAELYNYESMEYFANREYLKTDPEERATIIENEHPGVYIGTNVVNEDLIYNYYSYDLEDNLFYKYLARKRME